MEQTKLESLIEVTLNIFIGWCVSMLVTVYIVVPVWHLDWSLTESFWVTMVYTLVAIIRGYFVRRFFNAGLHKVAHNLAKQLL